MSLRYLAPVRMGVALGPQHVVPQRATKPDLAHSLQQKMMDQKCHSVRPRTVDQVPPRSQELIDQIARADRPTHIQQTLHQPR